MDHSPGIRNQRGADQGSLLRDHSGKINGLLCDETIYLKTTDRRKNPTTSTEKFLNKLLLQIMDKPAPNDSSRKHLDPNSITNSTALTPHQLHFMAYPKHTRWKSLSDPLWVPLNLLPINYPNTLPTFCHLYKTTNTRWTVYLLLKRSVPYWWTPRGF